MLFLRIGCRAGKRGESLGRGLLHVESRRGRLRLAHTGGNLYASEFSDQPCSGKTVVVDQLKALEEMPKNLRDALEKGMLAYQIQETGHYNIFGRQVVPQPTNPDLGW